MGRIPLRWEPRFAALSHTREVIAAPFLKVRMRSMSLAKREQDGPHDLAAVGDVSIVNGSGISSDQTLTRIGGSSPSHRLPGRYSRSSHLVPHSQPRPTHRARQLAVGRIPGRRLASSRPVLGRWTVLSLTRPQMRDWRATCRKAARSFASRKPVTRRHTARFE